MSSPQSDSIRVSCAQLNSGDDLQTNLSRTANLIAESAAAGSRLILLPENFSFMSADEKAKLDIAEPEEASSILAFLSKQARLHNITIIGGSVLLNQSRNSKIRNCCPVFSRQGELVAHYDKMHLFDALLPNEAYNESHTVEAGSQPTIVELEDNWKIGLSICYDLRFPELYRHYSAHGCNILSVPAAFTVPTGKEHWETLLRTRAIENQSYVIASGQCGTHPGSRETWGHSMIIDPWGEVLAGMNNEEGYITADLSLDRITEIRSTLPALNHRRIYSLQ